MAINQLNNKLIAVNLVRLKSQGLERQLDKQIINNIFWTNFERVKFFIHIFEVKLHHLGHKNLKETNKFDESEAASQFVERNTKLKNFRT